MKLATPSPAKVKIDHTSSAEVAVRGPRATNIYVARLSHHLIRLQTLLQRKEYRQVLDENMYNQRLRNRQDQRNLLQTFAQRANKLKLGNACVVSTRATFHVIGKPRALRLVTNIGACPRDLALQEEII